MNASRIARAIDKHVDRLVKARMVSCPVCGEDISLEEVKLRASMTEAIYKGIDLVFEGMVESFHDHVAQGDYRNYELKQARQELIREGVLATQIARNKTR